MRQRSSNLRVLRDTLPRYPRLNCVPVNASADQTEASASHLARVGVVGPKRAKRRPKRSLREGGLEGAVTVAWEDTDILFSVELR